MAYVHLAQNMGAACPFCICDEVQIYWCAGIHVAMLLQPTHVEVLGALH